jgi:hypothetical protein
LRSILTHTGARREDGEYTEKLELDLQGGNHGEAEAGDWKLGDTIDDDASYPGAGMVDMPQIGWRLVPGACDRAQDESMVEVLHTPHDALLNGISVGFETMYAVTG